MIKQQEKISFMIHLIKIFGIKMVKSKLQFIGVYTSQNTFHKKIAFIGKIYL